ncbi:hypothetical protein SAMN04488020_103213 [Palleronia marisminoris]|uniref:Uncharacterized protein n=1 Tax=Palleronia marisminoris TaxID=315423 RepID=A0A1Y5SAN8_9RHOB|nr:hypothetical protein [Palleronia marisminoris]SFG69460.1 hypothetical protein SAMN04488020_103213 [Palleronia marisminoris]SLN35648.1 hypothetical protein PAM7066_01493 [Palleronia marisminoris]
MDDTNRGKGDDADDEQPAYARSAADPMPEDLAAEIDAMQEAIDENRAQVSGVMGWDDPDVARAMAEGLSWERERNSLAEEDITSRAAREALQDALAKANWAPDFSADVDNVLGDLSGQKARLYPRPPDPPQIDFPDLHANFTPPFEETNQRLEQIEGVLRENVTTQLTLQELAGRFLRDFQAAAASNDVTSKRGIWMAGAAVIISLLTLIATILVPLMTPDREAEALRESIEALTQEVTSQREVPVPTEADEPPAATLVE